MSQRPSAAIRIADRDERQKVSLMPGKVSLHSTQGSRLMKTYRVSMTRTVPSAGPRATFVMTVQATSSAMARVTAEAQYPGYRCLNGPVPVS